MTTLFLAPEIAHTVQEVTPAVEHTCSGERGRNLSMNTCILPSSYLIRTVAQQLDGARIAPPVDVQTCGHTPGVVVDGERYTVCSHETEACRDVVALSRGASCHPEDADILISLAARAGVPFYDVAYDPSDHLAPASVLRGGVPLPGGLLGFRMALSEDQWRHEEVAHPQCSSRGEKPDRRLASEWKNPYMRSLRRVHGARHARADGIVVCASCPEPLAVLDTFPYSNPYRRNRAGYLTHLAASLGVGLVFIEHADKRAVTSSVTTLLYEPGQERAGSETRGTFYDAIGVLYDIIDEHQCSVGGR